MYHKLQVKRKKKKIKISLSACLNHIYQWTMALTANSKYFIIMIMDIGSYKFLLYFEIKR